MCANSCPIPIVFSCECLLGKYKGAVVHSIIINQPPGSGVGTGVPLLLVRNLRNIRVIQNLRLSLSLTLTKEVDLLGPDWNLTRRPLLLTPVVSFCRGGEHLGLVGLLPSAPHLHLSALPPITSQHPPTIWKGPSLPTFPSPCNQLTCTGPSKPQMWSRYMPRRLPGRLQPTLPY